MRCDRTHIQMSKAMQSKKLIQTLHAYAERIWKCKLMWKGCLLLWGHLIKEATNQNMTHDKGDHDKSKHGQWHELVGVCRMWKCFFKRGNVKIGGDNQKHTLSVTLINGLSRTCRQTSTLQLIRMQAWRSYTLEGVNGIVPNGDARFGERGSREVQKRG